MTVLAIAPRIEFWAYKAGGRGPGVRGRGLACADSAAAAAAHSALAANSVETALANTPFVEQLTAGFDRGLADLAAGAARPQ